MGTTPAKSLTLEELWDFEDKHPVIFASPRALAEARLINELEALKQKQRKQKRSAKPLRKRF